MLQIHFRHTLGGHPVPCRYEKLRNVGDARPRRRWVKKMSGGLKGLRLSRSRKLKTLCSVVFANRITRIYADIAHRLKMDGTLCPNIIFATHWGLPTLSHTGRLSSLSTQI
ncbi:hypothetical protein QQP08_017007 [Theobroma cacao]|nr:hypothetical protein QQP08_016355 [Theobroma cacao]WRX24520.1 hypothetical protein QQP08_017007 [Theobroma cacao]